MASTSDESSKSSLSKPKLDSEARSDKWLQKPFKSAKARRLELIAYKAQKVGIYKASIDALEKLQKDAKDEYRRSHSGQFGLVEQLEDAESGFARFNKNDYSFEWCGNKIRFNFYNVQDVWSQIEDQFHLIKSSVTMRYTKIAHPVTGGAAVVAKFSECLEGEGWGIHSEKAEDVHPLIKPSQLENEGYYNVKKTGGGIGTHDVLRCKLVVPIIIIMHKDSLKDAYASHYDEANPVDIQTWINSIAPNMCNFSRCTL